MLLDMKINNVSFIKHVSDNPILVFTFTYHNVKCIHIRISFKLTLDSSVVVKNN